jgi:hypothetical protein
MENAMPGGSIPPTALHRQLQLTDVDSLLRAHGASVRSVDNHHWQISRGDRSGLWLLGDREQHGGGGLDEASLDRLRGVLRQTGLLREQGKGSLIATPKGAAILWAGNEATRAYRINDQGLRDGGHHSLGHWLQGELTLHRDQRAVPYLRRIVAMLERIERALLIGLRAEAGPSPSQAALPVPEQDSDRDLEAAAALPEARGWALAVGNLERLTRLLEQERPDLRQRVVGVLSMDNDRLDDAMLFAMAREYLLPRQEPLRF